PANDVEQRGFARTGRTKDGDKLTVAEAQVDMVQRLLGQAAGAVFLADIFDLQHGCFSFILPSGPPLGAEGAARTLPGNSACRSAHHCAWFRARAPRRLPNARPFRAGKSRPAAPRRC